jgi:hypothetical protein
MTKINILRNFDTKSLFPFKNRRDRLKILILISLLLLLGLALKYNYSYREEKTSKCVLICKKCRLTAEREFVDIEKERCEICGRPMYRAYKCRNCYYEFAVVENSSKRRPNETEEQYRTRRIVEKKCRNCGSLETAPLGKKYKR